MQRLSAVWQQLTTRLPTRRAAASTDDLATLTQQHGDLLTLRWWYWRHHFLEAKRRTLDTQRDQ